MIYLVCRNVDLGSVAEEAYSDEKACYDRVHELNEQFRKQKTKDLLAIGYSENQAKVYLDISSDEYFMDELELKS